MRLALLLGLGSVALTGCGLMLDLADDAGPDPGMDAGSNVDAGAGTPCGPVTCAPGLECCNSSCGYCVGPLGSCTDEACLDAGADDAGPRDGGGVSCGPVTCGSGEQCCPGCFGSVFCAGEATCPVPSCPPPTCGDGVLCPDSEYCAVATGACSAIGTCTPRPGTCPEDCPGVCGCDGRTHCNECHANAAGTTVASNAPCARTRACEPMDVASVGDCLILLGYAWDGFGCSPIDCICEGTQCGELFLTQAACLVTYERCRCGGFLGLTCPADAFCDYAPGTMCGAGDGDGACRPRPTGCSGPDAPVCGCMGNDYRSACHANAAGESVYHSGRCMSPTPGP